ncbi:MAG: hypothetical protein CSA95_05680 [Bacteroidetes bacterium]|nr:MAG: hypothetical protein CSA95_05680 [Bacteroidota bacterium]
MKKLVVLMVLFLCLCSSMTAQESNGYTVIDQDIKIDSLLERDQEWHKNNPLWDGFRIQLFFDAGNNSKHKAQEVIEGFISKFPEMPAYLSFREPYYRVRIGNFHTRFQALKMLSQVIKDYPQAFIVKESINYRIPSFQDIFPKEEEEELYNQDETYPED